RRVRPVDRPRRTVLHDAPGRPGRGRRRRRAPRRRRRARLGAALRGRSRGRPRYRGESAYSLSINRNKRDLRLDLKPEGGREVLRRLIARSDVLVENYRVGGLERLGFPDAELERLTPRLVRLSITGYGPDGPLADRPGYDFIIQAVAGLMSITGAPDPAGGEAPQGGSGM